MSDPLVTIPTDRQALPIRTLRVQVIDGPDAGATFQARGDTVTIGTADGNDLRLADDSVSRYHAELSRGRSGVTVVDCGSTNGTFIRGVRVVTGEAPAGSVIEVGRSKLKVDDGDEATVELHDADQLAGLWGRSPGMRRLMSDVRRAANSDVSVLVIGESGTGKELVARALHDLGPRADQPFVAVDCGALAPTLVASELFGHERGAFTGADQQHAGAFERAHGGTLFLDEIGELPLALQATLLGALERRRFRRLGGRAEIAIDVRVVGATNRDVRGDVNSGAFRLDLYYRLAVVTLRVPPLRERAEDIDLLVAHFLARGRARRSGRRADLGVGDARARDAPLAGQRARAAQPRRGDARDGRAAAAAGDGRGAVAGRPVRAAAAASVQGRARPAAPRVRGALPARAARSRAAATCRARRARRR